MKSFGPPSPFLRSPQFSSIRGAKLTDSRIRYYMLAGFYGESRRVEALAEVEKKTKRKKIVSSEDISVALSLLSNL